MKNKPLTYILGLAVIIVLGIIIYRVFDAASASGDDTLPSITNTLPNEPFNDFSIPEDTSRLLLNYRDPFGLGKQKDTIRLAAKPNPRSHLAAMPAKPAFNWGFVQYAGYVRNPGSKKLITIISINGKMNCLRKGKLKTR